MIGQGQEYIARVLKTYNRHPGDLEKLPRWARDTINSLGHKVASAEARVQQLFNAASDAQCERRRLGLDADSKRLPCTEKPADHQ